MKKKSLIVWGGWDGHEPDKVAERFAGILRESAFEVEVSDTLEAFNDLKKLEALDLIVPIWTMGKIEGDQCTNVSEAVANGVGLGGCHGGMCDAFRQSTLWQFMTGGNWVSHPGGGEVEYSVNIVREAGSPLDGIVDFSVKSEQYYLHVDPAVKVLATTRFPTADWYHSSNGSVDMPVAWTKMWGAGRIYYNSLGHINSVFDVPEALEMMTRGLLWAAEGREVARKEGLSRETFQSSAKMF